MAKTKKENKPELLKVVIRVCTEDGKHYVDLPHDRLIFRDKFYSTQGNLFFGQWVAQLGEINSIEI